MKKRKFADGGETTEMEPSAKPEGGRFGDDTYTRARKFVESSQTPSKPAAKKAPKMAADPTAGEAKDKAAQRAADMMGSASTSKPAKAVEPAPQRVEVVGKKEAKDDTSKSLSERMKASRERARSSSTGTDTRSVSERIKGALGFSKGGSTKKYASGGVVGSVSKRADGVASKGKTRCKVV